MKERNRTAQLSFVRAFDKPHRESDLKQESSERQRNRGRPREFDEDAVLEAASQVFWTNGFNTTSLDQLADAMNMNRPSIYRAFGDKEALYRRVLSWFSQHMKSATQQTLFSHEDISVALEQFFKSALFYISGNQAKGCLALSTTVCASVNHPDIRQDLLNTIKDIDT